MSAPSLPSRVNLVTLGVADVAASTAFYESLGWRRSKTAGNDTISFFALGNLVLAIFGRRSLAEDAQVTDTPPGFGGFTLAINMASEAEVDAALAAAVAAGAKLLKPGQRVFWGGYSGYFADPDGHPWEVAFNPFWPLDANGLVVLPQ
ncbi:VOC family protein [Chelatococcus sp. SYSU_G07232]|uniref:VOC family protein n=1 Tax=Chelatococcus albus TaxID=3047466 RepID=A0ABT7AEN6_9HYPH|nr:VOC family protein [Chelatococcus sp. SYSU_G07232]MDJ1157827.1 VOC family protein [Chelatococcus sp. SYSU_G07232]